MLKNIYKKLSFFFLKLHLRRELVDRFIDEELAIEQELDRFTSRVYEMLVEDELEGMLGRVQGRFAPPGMLDKCEFEIHEVLFLLAEVKEKPSLLHTPVNEYTRLKDIAPLNEDELRRLQMMLRLRGITEESYVWQIANWKREAA